MKKTIFLAFALLFQIVTPAANPLCRVPLPKPIPQQQNPVQADSGGLLQGMLSDWRVIAAGVTTLSALSGLAYYYFKRRMEQDPAPDQNQDNPDDANRDEEDEKQDEEGDEAGSGGEDAQRESVPSGRRGSESSMQVVSDPDQDDEKHEESTSRRGSEASTVSWSNSESSRNGDDQAENVLRNASSGRRASGSSVASANASVLVDDGNIAQGLSVSGGIGDQVLLTEREFQKIEKEAPRGALGQLLDEVNAQGGQSSELSNAINGALDVLPDQEDEKQEEQDHVVLNVPARSESPSIAGSASTEYASVSSSYYGDNDDGSVASDISSGTLERDDDDSVESVVDDMLAKLQGSFDVPSNQEDEEQQEDQDHVVLSIPRRESVGSAMANESHGQANASGNSANNDARDDGGHKQQVVEHITRLLTHYFRQLSNYLDQREIVSFRGRVMGMIGHEKTSNGGVIVPEKKAQARRLLNKAYAMLQDSSLIENYFDDVRGAERDQDRSHAHVESYVIGAYQRYFDNARALVTKSGLAQYLGLNTSAASLFSMDALFEHCNWNKERVFEIRALDGQGMGNLSGLVLGLERSLSVHPEWADYSPFATPLSTLLAIRFAYGLDVWRNTQLSFEDTTRLPLQEFKEACQKLKEALAEIEEELEGRASHFVRIDAPVEQTTDPIESQGFLEYVDQIIDEGGSPQTKCVLTQEYLQSLQGDCATRSNAVINGGKAEIMRLANKGADWVSSRIAQPYQLRSSELTNDTTLMALERARVFEQEEREALHESLDTIAGLMWFIFANSLAQGEVFVNEGDFMLMEGDELSSDVARYLHHFYNVANKLFLAKGDPIVELSNDLQRDLANSVQEADIAVEFCLHMRYNITDNSPKGTYRNVLPPHNYGKLHILILKNQRVYLRPEAVDSWRNVARNVVQVATETGSDVARRGAALVAHAHATTLRGSGELQRLSMQGNRPRPVPVTRGLRHTGRVAGLIDDFLKDRDRNRGSWAGAASNWLTRWSGQPAVSYEQQIRKGGVAEVWRRLGRREQDGRMREELKQLFPYDTTDEIRQARFGSEVIITADHLRTWAANRAQARLQ